MRPGRRGPGSKPARPRSIDEFAEDYGIVRSDRGYAREARRRRKAIKRDAEKAAGITYETLRRDLMVAVDAIYAGTATQEQRTMVNRSEDAKFFAARYGSDQSAHDRIFGSGFVFPGGMIAGKYYRAKFVERGLRTWRHPFFMRVAASIGRASRGKLRTGPEKDKCVVRYNKLSALDELYAFFCEECRDMWRLDCDKIFDSEEEMRSWIAHIVNEKDLPCGPHLAGWVPDDRFPGVIIKPHFIFLLPEGSAVWPKSPDRQKVMLGQVIAALTRAFECDPGGLYNPFHGKNPISPLTTSIVYQDTHMPTLEEYFQAMDCTLDPELMVRFMFTASMEEAGFDKADSNTWWSSVARMSNNGGQTLFKGGTASLDDEAHFIKQIVRLIRPSVYEAIKPLPSQKKAVDKLIGCCARYTAKNFDPSKLDAKGRDRGAAAHLIEATDSLKVKRQKGKAFSDHVKITETRSIITKAIIAEMKAGREPTIASITAVVPRCYNSVKNHFFACYQTAVASISLGALLRGSTILPMTIPPSHAALLTANRTSDIPGCWADAARDPVVIDHFRIQALRASCKRRDNAKSRSESRRPVGRLTLDFMAAGQVTVYMSRVASKAA